MVTFTEEILNRKLHFLCSVVITFHENQILNLGNQYQKNATQVAAARSSNNRIIQFLIKLKETLREQEIKFPKTIEALHMFFFT